MKDKLLFAGLGLAGACITVNALPPDAKVIESAFAGSWYTADPAHLRSQIKNWCAAAEKKEEKVPAAPIAVIAPHAGYEYSGPTAACAYRTLAGKKFDRVIVLGPSHRVYLPNEICLPEADGFRTPLGSVPTDRAALRELARLPFVRVNDRVHAGEHSVQLQFPFLQTMLDGNFQVIPVITGQLDDETVRKTASALSAYLTPKTLVVISSDFTHYGRDFDYVPFKENIAENLRKLDLGAFELIRPGNAVKFARYIRETGATICGEGPIRILLEMLPAKAETVLLRYANSADGNGDYSHCVSYAAGAVSGEWEQRKNVPQTGSDTLPDSERIALLKMARASIEYVFKNRKATPSTEFSSAASGSMLKKMGCFVTLNLDHDLRGCIGEIEPYRPLYQAVTARAVDAAFRDPRFPQLSPGELRRVEIEISALTPARPVASYREIVIGRHGMTIEKDGRSAVFLPQVAPEQGWDLAETLTYLSRKAGLPADAWKSPDAKFTVFEAVVFRESDFPELRR
ncbi:MAG: AmmeMemoRadiSam system protein B [Lentisphaeria bacterium]|nr:AmmeMemoRadiSam system protein B [Lentisphaeria bacterium]